MSMFPVMEELNWLFNLRPALLFPLVLVLLLVLINVHFEYE